MISSIISPIPAVTVALSTLKKEHTAHPGLWDHSRGQGRGTGIHLLVKDLKHLLGSQALKNFRGRPVNIHEPQSVV